MNYLSVSKIAKLLNLSERSVRNYCVEGRMNGAILVGKIWLIPSDAIKPSRKVKEVVIKTRKTIKNHWRNIS